MVPSYNKVHNAFKLNGYHYSFNQLKEVAYCFIKEGDNFEQDIGVFLSDWLDAKSYILAKTSGSTGEPKVVKLNKQAMVHSAIATGDALNLIPGDTALHCLPIHYIAGKMMLVRAIILGLELDLVAPVSQVNFKKTYQFCAMVPLQVDKSLNNLNSIATLLVGGAPIPSTLKKQLFDKQTSIVETYGMTETITHVALKSVPTQSLEVFNNHSDCFKAIFNVTFSKDDRNCLIINAPYISKQPIVTNDVVDLKSETTFQLKGRIDHVINSGGIKIFPETVEAILSNFISIPFFITGLPHKSLGEQVVLVLEGVKETPISNDVFKSLTKYQKPKQCIYTPTFIRTKSGKINRKETLKCIKL